MASLLTRENVKPCELLRLGKWTKCESKDALDYPGRHFLLFYFVIFKNKILVTCQNMKKLTFKVLLHLGLS